MMAQMELYDVYNDQDALEINGVKVIRIHLIY